jgi:signal transduction histidine kinase
VIAAFGWVAAATLAVLVVRLRQRLELVARAEHELRGPLTAFSLGLDAARGTPAGRRLAFVLDAELARARGALADLAAARLGRRAAVVREPVRVDRLLRSSGAAWGAQVRSSAGLAVVRGDRARLAQALGNVMSNAAEHGDGKVAVVASRAGDRLRIEVRNPVAGRASRGTVADPAAAVGAHPPAGGGRPPGRGRGLEIAADAAAESGGRLTTAIGPRRALAVLDLPLEP